MKKLWHGWSAKLPERFTVERALTPHRQPVLEVAFHAFGDASTRGVSIAVYAVVRQERGTTQGLVCATSRLAKRNLTIPRLELVAGHIAVNLATNVKSAFDAYPVSVHCWLDSTVALYWINGQGEYRQFVSNRVNNNQEPRGLRKWRGGSVIDNQFWKQGPPWLSDPSKWPPDLVLEPCAETKAESKVTRSIFAAAIQVRDAFDQLLDAHTLHKVLRIGAWIQRFIRNCQIPSASRKTGLLDTTEIEQQKFWWIKRAQLDAQTRDHFEEDKLQLNLQPNDQLILECRGRIQGEYPTYLPDMQPSIHLQAGTTGTSNHTTRWSCADHGQRPRSLMGPKMTPPCQKGKRKLLGMQEIQGPSIPIAASRQPAQYKNARMYTLSSARGRLRGAHPLPV